MSFEESSYLASGNINVSRFVTPVIGSQGYVAQATASTRIIGVSQEAPRDPVYSTDSTVPVAAATGDDLRIYGRGRKALVRAGGTVSAGHYLVADASGQAVSADLTATGLQFVGGRALNNGVSGELIEVIVDPMSGRFS